MVNISKKRVQKKILERISDLLIIQVARIHTRKRAEQFITELLTPTEKIMLAKRFAATIMLAQGYSYSAIEQALSISHTTVAKLRRFLKEDRLQFVESLTPKTKKKKDASDFLVRLEIALTAGLPPRGRGRWRTVHRLTEKSTLQKKREKR